MQLQEKAGLTRLRTSFSLIPLGLAIAAAAAAPAAAAAQSAMGQAQPAPGQELVQRALANELRAAQDENHPMRYVLRKASPRLTTTKNLIETRDGLVAMLVAINDQPLNAPQQAREQARLNALLADPARQRHRKMAEDADTQRALKVLRVLPAAFVYRYAGPGTGTVVRYTFQRNPNFSPPDLETEVLTAVSGEIWIDSAQARVVRLQGQVQRDVDFGWGILGRLYKGGWIILEQADVGGGVWRVVKFQIAMSARVVIRTRNFLTTENESGFTPVPQALSYRDGIALLREAAAETAKR